METQVSMNLLVAKIPPTIEQIRKSNCVIELKFFYFIAKFV